MFVPSNDDNFIDHASSLDLDELTDKANDEKPQLEESRLNNNEKESVALSPRNEKSLLKMVKKLEARCSLLESAHVDNRSEIQSLKEKIKQSPRDDKNNVVPYLLELLSGKIGNVGLDVIGKLLGSALKNIGPISINFGDEK